MVINRRAGRVIAVGALICALASAETFQELGSFSDGKGHLAVRTEVRNDGGKRGLIRIDSSGHGGILIFDKAQWASVVAAVQRGNGQAEDTGGYSLRVERGPRGLRLSRLEHSGGGGPAVVFELASGDAPSLNRALDAVTQFLGR